MKIAVVRRVVDPAGGGGERYAATLVGRLRARGHEVHVYATRVGELPEGVIHHRVPCVEFWSPLKHWTFARAARRMIEQDRDRYDIVQALGQAYPSDVYHLGDGFHRFWMRTIAPRPGQRLLKWLLIKHPVRLLIEKRLMDPRNYRRLVAPSLAVKRQATRLWRVPPSRVDVIPPGIDASWVVGRGDVEGVRTRHGLTNEDLVLLFVSHNHRRKGLATVLEALARVREPRFKLVVVGKEGGGAFVRMAARLGVGAQVRWAGPTRHLEDYYAAAQALVFPSLYDPFGLVVPEAMAAGLVVVTSATAGASDLIRHGENGFVIRDGRDVDGLAAVLPRLTDPVLRKTMGQRASETWNVATDDLNAEKTLEVYARILDERRVHRREIEHVAIERLGALDVNARHRALLEKAEIQDYRALAGIPPVRTLHALKPERTTDLLDVGGEPIVRKRFMPGGGDAEDEWRMLVAFARAGVRAPVPVAVGREGRESALLTEFVRDGEQLDHWSARMIETLAPKELLRRKRIVIRTLAEEIGHLHRAGFTHRDLYLCHVFIQWDGAPRYRIMDLHRVEHHRRPPRRLIVKDLAALHFAASRWVRPTTRDGLRFLKIYLGEERLRPAHRRLIGAVLRKSARMEHHNRGRPI
ncbi:MAG: glycosyltransferase [Myxococcales bacterium]|nr:glycosyltransferase [Myxococcales bacterium]